MDVDTKSLLFNVLGGIIVSALTAIYIGARHRLHLYRLQRLLGFQFKNDTVIRMTYGQFLLPSQARYPYIKAPRRGVTSNAIFSMEHPISECEVRASTYLATLLGRSGKIRPVLVSDTEADSSFDSNFINFGGIASNYKTADTLASEANIFIRMNHNGLSLLSGEKLPSECSNDVDHGFILRITPPEFPLRSWIVCAGMGEWGTSGSAWYLANKWKELIERLHPPAYWIGISPDFLAMIRVRPGQDQSARLVALYRNDHGQVSPIVRVQ